jgi:membrane protease YdiL (CAAX protease family)
MSEKKDSSAYKKWLYCPGCGNKLPPIQNLKFCIKCGLNLSSFRKSQKNSSYQTKFISETAQPIQYGIEKLSIEELLRANNKQLWGISASIGLPILAFIIMSFLGAGILIFIALFNLNLKYLEELATNTYFVVFSSLLELLFILIPVVYVGKYLRRPKLDDRLRLLGFTTKGYEKIEILKEVLIGLVFAFIGIFSVFGVTLLMELILFNSEVMSAGEVDAMIANTDALGLFLLVLVMLLVVGTSEEVLFRGFMQKGLVRSKLGEKWGIFITALIFALIHLVTYIVALILGEISLGIFTASFISAFFPYMAISLLLGWLFRWRGENLIAVMIAHGAYDAILFILAYMLYNVV